MSGGHPPAAAVRTAPSALLLFCVAFATWTLTNMDQSLFGYAVPDLIRDFGLSLEKIGALVSMAFVVGIFAASLGGIATDMWGPRRTLPICLGVSAILVGLQGLAGNAAIFSVLRVAGYGFSAALSPICNAIVANAYSEKRRPLMIGALQCGYPMGWFVASFIVAPLISGHGWRVPFLVAFGVAPIAPAFALLLPRPTREPRRAATSDTTTTAHPLRLLLTEHRRKALLGTLAFFLYGGSTTGTIFYLPTFFQQVRGYDAATAAMIVGLSYGISMIGYIGSALVSQTLLTRRATTALWMLAAAVGLGVMIWLPRTASEDIAAFSVTAIFFFGTAAVLTAYLLELFPPYVRATASGICASGGLSAGSVVFPLLIARLTGHLGWQMSLSIVVIPLLLLCVVVILTLPKDG